MSAITAYYYNFSTSSSSSKIALETNKALKGDDQWADFKVCFLFCFCFFVYTHTLLQLINVCTSGVANSGVQFCRCPIHVLTDHYLDRFFSLPKLNPSLAM